MSTIAQNLAIQHHSAELFGTERRSRTDLAVEGRGHRREVPLDSHAEVTTGWPGRDPVAILQAQESTREPELVPLRYGRMATSPFAFLRGSAAVMAHDLAHTPTTSLTVQLCGDAHVANFGMFAAPDRRLVFDLNDFDETYPGSFEWDLKRLAASIVVAGRHVGVKDRKARAAAASAAESYRTTLARLATMSPLEVWYARVEVDELVDRLRGSALEKQARRASAKSRRNTGDVAVGKLTELGKDGRRRFRDDPPLLVPVDETVEEDLTSRIAELFRRYLESLDADRAVLLARYSYRALAHKVVGVGSVGTRALVMLLESGDRDPLLLQVKQAGTSVLEGLSTSVDAATGGERVVVGQRLLQATGDPFLGWTTGTTTPRRDYFVRQLRDLKGGFDLERLAAKDLAVYARVCGAVLARAHARAGSAALLTGYLGSDAAFDDAIGRFALAYADITDADHEALVRAISAGDVPSSSE